MNITKVKLHLNEHQNSKVKALGEIVIDDEFVVHNLSVVSGDNRLYVDMPYRVVERDGKMIKRDVCHPIAQRCRFQIEDAMLREYAALGRRIQDDFCSRFRGGAESA